MPSLSPEQLEDILTCGICHDLMRDPCSLACGHSFCKLCLRRAFKHKRLCPSCRNSTYTAAEPQPNVALAAILRSVFPDQERDERVEEEEAGNTTREIPIFISNSGPLIPLRPCPMHLFEPRYRLLARRAMDGNKEFLFVWVKEGTDFPSKIDPEALKGTAACAVSIARAQETWDGRWMIDCAGKESVRILDCWEEPNSGSLYMAKVETLPHKPPSLPEPTEEEERIFDSQMEAIRRVTRGAAQAFPVRDSDVEESQWLWQAANSLAMSAEDAQRLLEAEGLAARREVLYELAVTRKQCSE
eukprot:Hpha_TRINITY_DN16426_c1_g2::TRINITY_DN16426_c1_g2_i1::g.162163::m.162163